MKLKIDVVNAFSEESFKGNPAAVIIIDEWLSVELMQTIAAENNLSETAFIKPLGSDNFSIRWFSPTSEADACGHATLASAWVLFNTRKVGNIIKFQTQVIGELTATLLKDGSIQMSFPRREAIPIEEIPVELLTGLSIRPIKILLSDQAYFAIYENQEQVKSVIHKKDILAKLAPLDVVVTAPSKNEDFVSRYFWPDVASGEDPVTGSIHAGLVPYWAERLGKQELLAYQDSTRGGLLKCKLEENRVLISGKAVRYLTGEITI